MLGAGLVPSFTTIKRFVFVFEKFHLDVLVRVDDNGMIANSNVEVNIKTEFDGTITKDSDEFINY